MMGPPELGPYCPWCEKPLGSMRCNIRVGKYYVALHETCRQPWAVAGSPDRNPFGARMDGTLETNPDPNPPHDAPELE